MTADEAGAKIQLMSLSIFGIRHHGPGSARSLRQALETLRPDCLLVEGPPDAADVLPLLAHPQMKPPVALLIYPPDQPQRAVFYPFAVFSPEWQALDYGLARKIAVRFMDLPQAHRLAMADDPESQISNPESQIHDDPIGRLAAAAGYSDGERWWEHVVEQRRNGADIFAAILEAMTALRESALPANIQRYGNVRGTGAAMVGGIAAGLIARVCIGLPGACASLNDDAATAMFDRIVNVNAAIGLLQNEEHLAAWRGAMAQLADQRGAHGIVAGRCCRLLVDAGVFAPDEAARRLSLALSTANEPAQAAAWIEGFLKDSGLLLLHDDVLWRTLDEWVTTLSNESFSVLLPLLRRTFSTFAAPERRQIGERARRGMTIAGRAAIGDQTRSEAFDQARAEAVLPLVAQLLGLKMQE